MPPCSDFCCNKRNHLSMTLYLICSLCNRKWTRPARTARRSRSCGGVWRRRWRGGCSCRRRRCRRCSRPRRTGSARSLCPRGGTPAAAAGTAACPVDFWGGRTRRLSVRLGMKARGQMSFRSVVAAQSQTRLYVLDFLWCRYEIVD